MWPESAPAQFASPIAEALGKPELITLGRVFATRGFTPEQTRDLLRSDPSHPQHAQELAHQTRRIGNLPHIETAATLIYGILQRAPIGLLCDFDVDGATSAAILEIALRAVGGKAIIVVPDRLNEGFGPNERCLKELVSQGAGAVITLDCGTHTGELLDDYHKQYGLIPIIVDHHPDRGAPTPQGGCVVNPWIERNPHASALCTGALAWFLGRAILRQNQNNNKFPHIDRQNIRRMTSLGALASVCDVMPMDHLFNRALVRAGLRQYAVHKKQLREEPQLAQDFPAVSPGLIALTDLAGIHYTRGNQIPTPNDLGWKIGPRINAGSRMGESDLAVRCLTARDPNQAHDLALQLDSYNRQRQMLCTKEKTPILQGGIPRPNEPQVIVQTIQSKNPGICGIIAGNLTRSFGWPAVVLAQKPNQETTLAGSGRSANGFDLGACITEILESPEHGAQTPEPMILKGGGHAAACGLEVPIAQVENLAQEMTRIYRKAHPEKDHAPVLRIDARLQSNALSRENLLRLGKMQEQLAPWGNRLTEPLYGFRNLKLQQGSFHQTKNKNHTWLKLVMTCEHQTLTCTWFSPPKDWMRTLGVSPQNKKNFHGNPQAKPVDILGRVEVDRWQGAEKPNIMIEHVRQTPIP